MGQCGGCEPFCVTYSTLCCCCPQERLANALASEVGVTNKQLSHLKKSEREHLLTALTAWQLPIQVGSQVLGRGSVLSSVVLLSAC